MKHDLSGIPNVRNMKMNMILAGGGIQSIPVIYDGQLAQMVKPKEKEKREWRREQKRMKTSQITEKAGSFPNEFFPRPTIRVVFLIDELNSERNWEISVLSKNFCGSVL